MSEPTTPITTPIYHIDAYCQEFEAVVVGRTDGGLLLDRTAFFPGGGGQPADRGTLGWNGEEHPLSGIQKTGDRIEHRLELAPERWPARGCKLSGRLDWEHRYQLMRTHTALHILCAVIWRDWQCQVTGSNMKPLAGRMDFEFEGMPAELAAEIVRRANREVEADREIRVARLARAEALQIPDLIRTKINLLPDSIREIRTVEIVGLDLQADGGTHVARSGEVGVIRLLKHESKGRINKRLRIALD